MLKNLQKFFNKEEVQVEMTTETQVEATQAVMPEVEAMAAELSELKASFAQVSETLAATQEQLATAQKSLEEANASLAAVNQAKADADATALQAKMDARLTKLQEAVGDVKADALMAATKEMNDEAFEAVAADLVANMDAEAQSAQFTETGVDAQPTKEEKKPVSFKNFLKTAK